VVIDIDGEKIMTLEPSAGAVMEAPSTAASEITSTPLALTVPLPVDCPEAATVPLPPPLEEPVEGPREPLAAAPLRLDAVPDDGTDPLPDGAPEGPLGAPDGARDPPLEEMPLLPALAPPAVGEHPVAWSTTAVAATRAETDA
jgi:hypothetical protein